MATIKKYQLVCNTCEREFLIGSSLEEEQDPTFCPFCASSITEEEDVEE